MAPVFCVGVVVGDTNSKDDDADSPSRPTNDAVCITLPPITLPPLYVSLPSGVPPYESQSITLTVSTTSTLSLSTATTVAGQTTSTTDATVTSTRSRADPGAPAITASAAQPGQSWRSLYTSQQNAIRPMKMLAATFGVLALVLVILIVSIVVFTRLRRRRRAERTRVRSVFWTGSRELVLSSSQPQPYATPGQERWAKQWEGLSHPAVTPPARQPGMTIETLTSTRMRTLAFLANTLSGRWSRSLTNDSPGNPPSYRSPSYSSSKADETGNRDARAGLEQSPSYGMDARAVTPQPQKDDTAAPG